MALVVFLIVKALNRATAKFVPAEEKKKKGYREFADKLFLNTMLHNRTRHNPYAAFSREEQNIINTFLCVTSVNIYRQWVADKKRVPLERLIALSGTLLSNGVISLF